MGCSGPKTKPRPGARAGLCTSGRATFSRTEAREPPQRAVLTAVLLPAPRQGPRDEGPSPGGRQIEPDLHRRVWKSHPGTCFFLSLRLFLGLHPACPALLRRGVGHGGAQEANGKEEGQAGCRPSPAGLSARPWGRWGHGMLWWGAERHPWPQPTGTPSTLCPQLCQLKRSPAMAGAPRGGGTITPRRNPWSMAPRTEQLPKAPDPSGRDS